MDNKNNMSLSEIAKKFISYEEQEILITEGVYDPSIFKAVFLVGSPGAGKTTLFKKGIKGVGLKHISSDNAFEYFLKKAGMSMKLDMDPKQVSVRQKAKNITQKQRENLYRGRLGCVLDGTGDDFTKVKVRRDRLQDMGYDTMMIFVNVPLDITLERNRKRERSLPDDLVQDIWEDVQGNMGKFQSLFGAKDFYIVDSKDANEEEYTRIFKIINKFIKKPVENLEARTWISQELGIKKRVNKI